MRVKRWIFGVLIILSQASLASDIDWAPVTTPEGLTPVARQNFELGVLASGALLCNYYDLYGQLSSLPADFIMFERGKAALVRETKRIDSETCKAVLRSVTAAIAR